jgi:hypothetical protein
MDMWFVLKAILRGRDYEIDDDKWIHWKGDRRVLKKVLESIENELEMRTPNIHSSGIIV